MWDLWQSLLDGPVLDPLIRPLARLVIGTGAAWLVQRLLKDVARLETVSDDVQEDVSRWLAASLLLLAATHNVEQGLFGLMPQVFDGEASWLTLFMRLMLAIGVVESMPNRNLFTLVHPCRWRPCLDINRLRTTWAGQLRDLVKARFCLYLAHSSPCLAILATIAPGRVGWFCYGLAVVQFLVIALSTSRRAALAALSRSIQQVEPRGQHLQAAEADELAAGAGGVAAHVTGGAPTALLPAGDRPDGSADSMPQVTRRILPSPARNFGRATLLGLWRHLK